MRVLQMFEFHNIEEEINMSTQFLQIQKNQLLELQHFERYVLHFTCIWIQQR